MYSIAAHRRENTINQIRVFYDTEGCTHLKCGPGRRRMPLVEVSSLDNQILDDKSRNDTGVGLAMGQAMEQSAPHRPTAS